MRIFVVGATGVLGRSLIPRLVSRGHSVLALVRSLERAEPLRDKGVELVEGDLLYSPAEQIEGLLAGCDVAAHLATALRPGSPGLGVTNTNAGLRTVGTRRLLDAALATGVPRLVQQSIALAYVDGGDAWLDEDTPFFQPTEPNGVASPVVQMEAMVRDADPGRLSWIILRGGAFVGPGTRQDDVIAALRQGDLEVPGDGSNWVSFIHTDDYAEAVALAMLSPLSNLVFNVTDEPVRNGEYLDALASRLGLPVPPRNRSLPLPRSYRCTSAAARSALGWAPVTSILPAASE